MDLKPVPLGNDIRANTIPGPVNWSSVTALADGGFVVTWSSQDGSGYGIYGQRYAPDGSVVGGEFRANTTIAGDHIASEKIGVFHCKAGRN